MQVQRKTDPRGSCKLYYIHYGWSKARKEVGNRERLWSGLSSVHCKGPGEPAKDSDCISLDYYSELDSNLRERRV